MIAIQSVVRVKGLRFTLEERLESRKLTTSSMEWEVG